MNAHQSRQHPARRAATERVICSDGEEVEFRVPSRDETWCQANPEMFLTTLQKAPVEPGERPVYDHAPVSESQARARRRRHAEVDQQQAAVDHYNRTLEVAREMCSRGCERFKQCLYDSLTGYPVDGFVAGTTPAERDRLREVLDLQPKSDTTINPAFGLAAKGGQTYDFDSLAPVIRQHDDWTTARLARHLGVSGSTVRRYRQKIERLDAEGCVSRQVQPHETAAEWHKHIRSA